MKMHLDSPENYYGELVTGETTLVFAAKELAHSNLNNGFLIEICTPVG